RQGRRRGGLVQGRVAAGSARAQGYHRGRTRRHRPRGGGRSRRPCPSLRGPEEVRAGSGKPASPGRAQGEPPGSRRLRRTGPQAGRRRRPVSRKGSASLASPVGGGGSRSGGGGPQRLRAEGSRYGSHPPTGEKAWVPASAGMTG